MLVTTQTRKLHTVQAFRGAAAMLVLLFHLTILGNATLGFDLLSGVFKFGSSGVDFFFILSGFIIYLVHSQDVGRPNRLGPYLRKRFLRIYPIYWIVALSLLLVYFSPVRSALNYSTYSTTLLKSLLLLPQADNPIVTVAWTLTFEVFFYAMFALAIYFPKRLTRILAVLWLLLSFVSYLDKMGAAGFFSRISPAKIHVINFLFNFYNLEFAAGCAVAYLLQRYRIRHGGKLALAGAAIFLIGGILNALYYHRFVKANGIASYGLPAALIVLGAVSWELRNGITLPAVLLLLGDASYSIYLTHYALLALLVKSAISLRLPALVGAGITLAIIFSLTLSAGLLFFIFVERPLLSRLLRRDKRLSRSPASAPLALATKRDL